MFKHLTFNAYKTFIGCLTIGDSRNEKKVVTLIVFNVASCVRTTSKGCGTSWSEGRVVDQILVK